MSNPHKSVVILGGASTVARAIAHEFGRAGYHLVLADFDQAENERIAADVRVRCNVPCTAIPFDALAYDTHEAVLDTCTANPGRSTRRRRSLFRLHGGTGGLRSKLRIGATHHRHQFHRCSIHPGSFRPRL